MKRLAQNEDASKKSRRQSSTDDPIGYSTYYDARSGTLRNMSCTMERVTETNLKSPPSPISLTPDILSGPLEIVPSQLEKGGMVKGIVTTTMVVPIMFMHQVVGAQGEVLMAVKAASGAEVTARTQGSPLQMTFWFH